MRTYLQAKTMAKSLREALAAKNLAVSHYQPKLRLGVAI